MMSVFSTLATIVLCSAVIVHADDPSSTWYKGTQACKAIGQELYHSADKFLVAGFLDVNSGRHWIGAKVMYSPWKWTDDQTELFTYVGYRNLTHGDGNGKTLLYTNQAVHCYSKCNTEYIGLQGTKCYCLHSPELKLQTAAQDRCWGNNNEYCGTIHGISVYKADLPEDDEMVWTFGLNSLCGYVKKIRNVYYGDLLAVQTAKLCNKTYGRICKCTDNDDCDEGLAIYSDTLNWAAANDSCSLIKLTNESDLTDYDNLHYSEQYWIGLRRHRYIGWIGRDGRVDVPDTGSNGCVWVERLRNGTVMFGVSSCATKHKPVCTNGTLPITTTTSGAPITTSEPRTTTVFLSRMTSSLGTLPITTTTSGAPMTTSEPRITTVFLSRTSSPLGIGQDKSMLQKQINGPVIGGSVAAVVAVVLVLVLLTLVWMKRKKRHCFAAKTQDPDIRHVPANENVYTRSSDVHSQHEYSNISYQVERADSDTLNNDNAYEFEMEPSRNQNRNEHSEVTNPNLEVSEVYELAGNSGNANPDMDGDYDALDGVHNEDRQCHGADIYSHIRTGHTGGDDDVYDGMTSANNTSPADPTYSHIHAQPM